MIDPDRKIATNVALLVASPVALIWAQGALAQSVATAPATDNQLQEIVVTAQKRSQNVQDAPLSITAVSGARLATSGITTVQELNRVDPALQIGQNSGAVQTFIRGIGNPATSAGNEASVPVYIDDVYFIRASPAFFDLADVERVEVLKGPQGTLFGRNASGGVISIYTRDPGDTTTVSGKIGYGNYDTVSGQLYVAGPLTDRLSADFSASAMRQGEGWGHDVFTGKDSYKNKYVSLRSKWVWRPTDVTTIKLIGYYVSTRGDIGIIERPFPGTSGGTPDGAHNGYPLPPGYPNPSQAYSLKGFYDTDANAPQYDKATGYGGSVRIDQSIGFANLVSISAIRRNNEHYAADGDYTRYNMAVYNLDIVDHQFSQEFQIKSKQSSKLTWIIGGYYLNALQGFAPTAITGDGPNGLGIQKIAITGLQRVHSYAGFGQATYPILPGTNITAGLRYTVDKLGGLGTTDVTFLPGVPGVGGTTLETARVDCDTAPDICRRTFSKVTYKAAADHHFGRSLMGYASYSRGYKSGTYEVLPLTAGPLKPEVVDAYEIGLKSELFDRKLRLNLALFWNDIESPQVQASRGGFVGLINAGSARTRGVEFDAEAVLARGLTARFSGTYLDARFRDFPDAPSYVYSTTSPGNLDLITVNADGHRMPFASKLKLSGGLNYARQIDGAGKIVLDLGGSYASRFNWDADNLIKEKAHVLLDSSIAFTPAALHAITIRLWMKNITGEKYNIAYLAQATGSAFSSAPGAPRTFGGEIGFNF